MSDKVACFRCKSVNMFLTGVKLNDTLICVCPTGYFGFTLYLSGCVVDPKVICGDRKEAKE